MVVSINQHSSCGTAAWNMEWGIWLKSRRTIRDPDSPAASCLVWPNVSGREWWDVVIGYWRMGNGIHESWRDFEGKWWLGSSWWEITIRRGSYLYLFHRTYKYRTYTICVLLVCKYWNIIVIGGLSGFICGHQWFAGLLLDLQVTKSVIIDFVLHDFIDNSTKIVYVHTRPILKSVMLSRNVTV